VSETNRKTGSEKGSRQPAAGSRPTDRKQRNQSIEAQPAKRQATRQPSGDIMAGLNRDASGRQRGSQQVNLQQRSQTSARSRTPSGGSTTSRRGSAADRSGGSRGGGGRGRRN
jgi:hypothetical protein